MDIDYMSEMRKRVLGNTVIKTGERTSSSSLLYRLCDQRRNKIEEDAIWDVKQQREQMNITAENVRSQEEHVYYFTRTVKSAQKNTEKVRMRQQVTGKQSMNVVTVRG